MKDQENNISSCREGVLRRNFLSGPQNTPISRKCFHPSQIYFRTNVHFALSRLIK